MRSEAASVHIGKPHECLGQQKVRLWTTVHLQSVAIFAKFSTPSTSTQGCAFGQGIGVALVGSSAAFCA